jgi:hypothetical protein
MHRPGSGADIANVTAWPRHVRPSAASTTWAASDQQVADPVADRVVDGLEAIGSRKKRACPARQGRIARTRQRRRQHMIGWEPGEVVVEGEVVDALLRTTRRDVATDPITPSCSPFAVKYGVWTVSTCSTPALLGTDSNRSLVGQQAAGGPGRPSTTSRFGCGRPLLGRDVESRAECFRLAPSRRPSWPVKG